MGGASTAKGGSAASSRPSDSNLSAAAAAEAPGPSKYLRGLPSRGLFSSTVISSNPGSMRVWVCEHDTSPPEDQIIKTNTTNILIRALQLSKQRGDPSEKKDVKTRSTVEGNKNKRSSERTSDVSTTAKRAKMTNESASTRLGESSSGPSEIDFQGLTVERLRALLKERSLSVRGRKDELIARLKEGEGDDKEEPKR
ncbi:hypothetical protein QJS04_geneDACA012637 [Acorus gramineus]|uniref:SAP domain-containing protein n=1 Tax=Acorus gramineus TaxID=55184 RepID=A0AAV9B5P9_ACOGR|nr:hypothetical protein QJS04_geneDACA012637 [Acorus gramineus]